MLMSVDKDEATRKREREAEAEAKRQQNVMPAWHLKSTISGDLTSLGVAANAHQSEALNGVDSNSAILSSLTTSSRSNADILSGLGKVRPVKAEMNEISIVKDVKPVINQTADCMCYLFIKAARAFILFHKIMINTMHHWKQRSPPKTRRCWNL